jgi:hypothetical protein
LKRLLLGILAGAIGLLLVTGGCATFTGVAIGGLYDNLSSDTEKLNVQNIKVLNYDTPLELILKDSTFLQGDFEGFVNSDSSAESSNRILPYRNETIDIYFATGSHQKFFFRSFYYRTSNNEVFPALRLGTKADDINQNMHESSFIVRANGDTVSSQSILKSYATNDYRGQSIVVRDPLIVISVPVNHIQSVTIIKEKNGIKSGLIIGALFDIAWYIYLRKTFSHYSD